MHASFVSGLMRRGRGAVLAFAVGAVVVFGWVGFGLGAGPSSGPEILEELRSFNVLGTLLYISAHPDDENTQLITYCAKGRHYRTAYLSLTRGDGGQNVIGPDFDESLGLIRTEELLAARRLDGGRQFFTRAIDFGYSKSADETLKIWDRKQVLGDVVRVIRMFRPDVVVTRFSPQDRNTHGHHTASSILALEAFRVAGDPNAYPEQLDTLQPWKPTRFLLNTRFGAAGGDVLRIPVDGVDPVTGEDFSTIAAQSRAMHKSQGFDNFGSRGGRGGATYESFTVLAGLPASKDIFDDIDTSWTRVPGGGSVARMTGAAIEKFDPANPAASVPALLEIRHAAAALPGDPVVKEKLQDLDRIIRHCLGLAVETRADHGELVPGEQFRLMQTASLASDAVPVRLVRIRYPIPGMPDAEPSTALKPHVAFHREASCTLPRDMSLSQPYWLRLPPEKGLYRVENPKLIGRPENPPALPIEWEFNVGGQTMLVPDQVLAGSAGASKAAERLEIIPPVWLKWAANVSLFTPGAMRSVEVTATASRPGVAGSIRLEMPEGWSVKPAAQAFRLRASGDSARFAFEVTAPDRTVRAPVAAAVEVNGRSFSNGRIEIRYSHIPPLLLQPAATMEAVSLHLAHRGERVGYIPGAGDSVAQDLADVGYKVTEIAASEISPEKLAGVDAVVIGIRAFETQEVLKSKLPELFKYVESGGTVVVQYFRNNGLESAPLPLRISRNRVTDEDAPVDFLAPDNPVLNTPNKITPADFEGWVQERSIYVPDSWDPAYVPVVSSHDPGEEPLKGQLLVAKYGKGYFVYTSFVFFRELPAGVPGAYRLFANLVSLGR
jgi:LmbE family N-acetylglucosaminyl deacetylase